MDRQELHGQIDHIFCDLLPAAGLGKREAQITLSHSLLDAMLDRKITLCDAGTGIGKTFAYLAAGFVFLNFRARNHLPFQPLIITTSSIALQTELHNAYIPQIAEILAADGWDIDQSALSVVRKGKRHYVCDRQLEWRLREVAARPYRVRELSRLQKEIDMDNAGKGSPCMQLRSDQMPVSRLFGRLLHNTLSVPNLQPQSVPCGRRPEESGLSAYSAGVSVRHH